MKTLLGLDKYKGNAVQYPIELTPAKTTKVSLYSTRLKTVRILTFDNSYQAAEFIERMNDGQYFEARICKEEF